MRRVLCPTLLFALGLLAWAGPAPAMAQARRAPVPARPGGPAAASRWHRGARRPDQSAAGIEPGRLRRRGHPRRWQFAWCWLLVRRRVRPRRSASPHRHRRGQARGHPVLGCGKQSVLGLGCGERRLRAGALPRPPGLYAVFHLHRRPGHVPRPGRLLPRLRTQRRHHHRQPCGSAQRSLDRPRRPTGTTSAAPSSTAPPGRCWTTKATAARCSFQAGT